MIRLTIDGTYSTGSYRVDCECQASWSGQGETIGSGIWSPALPVAECVVHHRLEHEQLLLELRFTDRFAKWLERYWEVESMRQYLSFAKPTGLRSTL
jgi:hypothetical protein